MAKKKTNKLADQLVQLLPDIDEDGLLFLIRQANTLIYNQKVDELNRQAEKLDESRALSTADAGKKKQSAKKSSSKQEFPVSVEKGAFGTSYIMVIGTVRKTFAEHEMLGLVKVCNAASDKGDAAARIYRWLSRNRDDVLLDAGIGSAKHPAFGAIYSTLKTTFRVREK